MSMLKMLKNLDSINYNNYSFSILSKGIIDSLKKEADNERVKSVQYFIFLLVNIFILSFIYLPYLSDFSFYESSILIMKSGFNWSHLSIYFLLSGLFIITCYFRLKDKNISKKRASDLEDTIRYISCCVIATIVAISLGFKIIILTLVVILSMIKITSCEVKRSENINKILKSEENKIKKKKRKESFAQFEKIKKELNSNKNLREEFLSFKSEIEKRKNRKYKNIYFFIFNNVFRKESEGLTKDNLINYLECKLKKEILKKENKITTE